MNSNIMDNQLFINDLQTDEGRTKIANATGAFVRTRLREKSFSRMILQPEYITPADCQRSVKHDGLVKIVDIEPNSSAMSLNFRGIADCEYITGDRYEIPFFNISSKRWQKTEEELLAFEMPITEFIESSSLMDIQAIEDEAFMAAVTVAIAAQTGGVGGDTTTRALANANSFNSYSGGLDPQLFVKLFNLLENSANTGTTGTHNFDAQRYEADCILMNRADYNKLLMWRADDRGVAIAEGMTVNGVTFPTLFGKRLIVTHKGELVPPGTMYAFAKQQYLGHSYILGDIKFFIKKEANVITFFLYESLGVGFGNVEAMAKVTWTN